MELLLFSLPLPWREFLGLRGDNIRPYAVSSGASAGADIIHPPAGTSARHGAAADGWKVSNRSSAQTHAALSSRGFGPKFSQDRARAHACTSSFRQRCCQRCIPTLDPSGSSGDRKKRLSLPPGRARSEIPVQPLPHGERRCKGADAVFAVWRKRNAANFAVTTARPKKEWGCRPPRPWVRSLLCNQRNGKGRRRCRRP